MTVYNYALAAGSGTTRILEAGDGPAVIFVHGLGARADRWRTTIERIGALGFRAIALDLPGHGFASKEPEAPATVPSIATYLLAVMDALEIETAVLVGTSLGAHIVAHAATQAPRRILALALVGALGVVPIAQSVAETIRSNVRISERDKFSGKLNFVFHDPAMVTQKLIDEEWRMNTAPGAIAAFTRLGDYLVDGISADYVAEPLRALYPSTRLLLIWGTEDKAVPLSVGQACAEALDTPLVTIDNANHVPYLEQPEAFDAALAPFLRAVTL
jgi:pimeloyl-ACP methyl ester carboxylesterase